MKTKTTVSTILLAIFLFGTHLVHAATCSSTQANANGTWWLFFDETVLNGSQNRVVFTVTNGAIGLSTNGWKKWTVNTSDVISEVFSRDVEGGEWTVGTTCIMTEGFIDLESGWDLEIVTANMDHDKHEIHGIVQRSGSGGTHYFPVGFHAIKRN